MFIDDSSDEEDNQNFFGCGKNTSTLNLAELSGHNSNEGSYTNMSRFKQSSENTLQDIVPRYEHENTTAFCTVDFNSDDNKTGGILKCKTKAKIVNQKGDNSSQISGHCPSSSNQEVKHNANSRQARRFLLSKRKLN